jgi:hypothetical protein
LTKKNFNPIYYVYFHVDPETDEIFYVGHGSGARAWISSPPFRDELHAAKLTTLESQGKTPDQWVYIIARGLSKEEACKIEREHIKKEKPLYNKVQGEKLLRVTPEILEDAFSLREQGWSFKKIAENFDLSTMTIHRAMAGKNPALEEVLVRRA